MMTAIFKADDKVAQLQVRAFREITQPHWPVNDSKNNFELAAKTVETVDNISPVMQSEADKLRHELAELGSHLKTLKTEAEEAETQAFERGLEQGKQIAASLEQERLDLLKKIAENSVSALNEQLAGLQILSLQISQLALSKIFGNSERFADLIAQSVQHRCAQISAELITGIRVSATDFPDDAALLALSNQIGRSDIRNDTRLNPGDCVIDLKLGRYDISVGPQWGRLQNFLTDLALEEAPK